MFYKVTAVRYILTVTCFPCWTSNLGAVISDTAPESYVQELLLYTIIVLNWSQQLKYKENLFSHFDSWQKYVKQVHLPNIVSICFPNLTTDLATVLTNKASKRARKVKKNWQLDRLNKNYTLWSLNMVWESISFQV